MLIIQTTRADHCVRDSHLKTCRDGMGCPQETALTSGKQLTSVLVIVTEIHADAVTTTRSTHKNAWQMRQHHPSESKKSNDNLSQLLFPLGLDVKHVQRVELHDRDLGSLPWWCIQVRAAVALKGDVTSLVQSQHQEKGTIATRLSINRRYRVPPYPGKMAIVISIVHRDAHQGI